MVIAAPERGFFVSFAMLQAGSPMSTSPVRTSKSSPKSKTVKGSTTPSPAVMPTYARQNVVFESGEGAWLISTTGERYLDFASGVAVNALGHAHPKLVAALTEQARQAVALLQPLPRRRPGAARRAAVRGDLRRQGVLLQFRARRPAKGAIKLARRYHFANGHPERWRIVTFKGAFHGRTLATIAAAGNEKYLEGFGEPAPGFDLVPFGDLEAVEKAIGPETAAIMVEPVQGEGGVRVGSHGSSCKALRELCDEHGLLLVLDEVQCGMGRTGKLFALRVGRHHARRHGGRQGHRRRLPGRRVHGHRGGGQGHGARHARLDLRRQSARHGGRQRRARRRPGAGLPRPRAATWRLRLKQELARLKDENPDVIEEVRGSGLLVGIKVKPPMGEVVGACMAEKLLTVGAGENVVRLLPPLNVTEAEIARGGDSGCRAL